MKGLLTTIEAAEIVGLSDVRIRQLIYAHKLPAQKLGKLLVIRRKDLHLLNDRKSGRPKLNKENKAA